MSLSGMGEIEFSIPPLNLLTCLLSTIPLQKKKMGASSLTKPSPEAEWLDNVPLRSRTAGDSLRTFAKPAQKNLWNLYWF